MKNLITALIFFVLIAGLVIFQFSKNEAKPDYAKLDESARLYLDEVIPKIIDSWSGEELTKAASPRLKNMLQTHPSYLSMFIKLKKLGKTGQYSGASGEIKVVESINDGKVTMGIYKAAVDYPITRANLFIEIIMTEQGWKILSFNVSTPMRLS